MTRIFLNNIQEDSRDAPYLSPGTRDASFGPLYATYTKNRVRVALGARRSASFGQ